MTMIKKEMTDKVEGFRVSDEVSKKLKQDLFRTDKTKKEWLENRVEQLENLHKVKNKPDAKEIDVYREETYCTSCLEHWKDHITQWHMQTTMIITKGQSYSDTILATPIVFDDAEIFETGLGK